MGLMHAHEVFRRDAELRGHAPAIFVHLRLVVIGAEAAVEAGINPFGDAALAGEERMAQAGHR
jgi:hypothetical protein